LNLGLKWAVLTALPASAFAILLITAHTVSRWSAIGLIVRLPYARTEGEATARPFAGRLSGAEWALSGVIGLAALTVAIAACDALGGVLELRALLLGCLAAVLSSLIAGRYFRQRIGGYTGDCLGAAQQLAELAFLLCGLAVIAPPRG
jgi:adenosylcobinamide-GDP ribazoletransferase